MHSWYLQKLRKLPKSQWITSTPHTNIFICIHEFTASFNHFYVNALSNEDRIISSISETNKMQRYKYFNASVLSEPWKSGIIPSMIFYYKVNLFLRLLITTRKDRMKTQNFFNSTIIIAAHFSAIFSVVLPIRINPAQSREKRIGGFCISDIPIAGCLVMSLLAISANWNQCAH